MVDAHFAVIPPVVSGVIFGSSMAMESHNLCRRDYLSGLDRSLCPRRADEPRQMIEAAGQEKALLCQAAERTGDGLSSAIGRIIDRFPPIECRN